MAREVVGKIVSITADEEGGGYVVEFWVGEEIGESPTLPEAFALLGSLDRLQRERFAMRIVWDGEQFGMEPDEKLMGCLNLYDQHDSVDELDELHARRWKTGQVADAIVTHLIDANVFGAWRTGLRSPDHD